MPLTLNVPPMLIKKLQVLNQLMPNSNMDIEEFFISQIDEAVSNQILTALGMARPTLPQTQPLGPSQLPMRARASDQHFAGLGDDVIEEEVDEDDGYPMDLSAEFEEETNGPVVPSPSKTKLKAERKPKVSGGAKKAKVDRDAALKAMEDEIDQAAAEDESRSAMVAPKGVSPEDQFAAELFGDPNIKAPKVRDDENKTPARRDKGPRTLPKNVRVSEFATAPRGD